MLSHMLAGTAYFIDNTKMAPVVMSLDGQKYLFRCKRRARVALGELDRIDTR